MTRSKTSILVVDDDEDACRNLADILTDLGYHVRTAGNGLAALALVRHFEFALAIIDFRMPGMDGLTLYREIKRIAPDILAIILSAYLTPSSSDQARQIGAWQVLTKPVNLGHLLPLIDEAASSPLILLVDDDQELCASLWDLLHDRGYRIKLAHTVLGALELVGKHEFDVAILDLKLPGGSGTDVLNEIQREYPETRSIVITGHRLELGDLVRQALAEGADAICYKPLDVPQILGTLERLTST